MKIALTSIRVNINRVRDNLFLYACAMVVFALPYSIKLTTIAILFLVFAWCLGSNVRRLSQLFKGANLIWMSTAILYLMIFFSLSYTENINVGLFELEKGITLLVFPIVLGSTKKFQRKDIIFVLWTFIVANLIFGIICLTHATIVFYFDNVNIFFYHDLVKVFHSHATYCSMYFIFSIIALVYIYYGNQKNSLQLKLITGFSCIFFTVLVYLLAIRAIIILFSIGAITSIIVYSIRSKNLKVGVPLLIGLLVIIFFAVNNISILRERLVQLKDYKYELSENHIEGYNGRTSRLAQWESSLEIIRESPLLGVGAGDVQDELQKVYKKNFLVYSFRERFNAHNQFIQTTLGLGFVGLVILLCGLAVPAIVTIKQKQTIYLSFLVLFSFCCVTESMLYVQKGIVFYSFFNSFFAFHLMEEAERAHH